MTNLFFDDFFFLTNYLLRFQEYWFPRIFFFANFRSDEFSFFVNHINLKGKCLSFTQIWKLLMNEDGIVCSKKSICKFWGYLKLFNWRWKGRKVPYWMFQFYRPETVQEQNSELAANELRVTYWFECRDVYSANEKKLGWTFNGTRFCQIISETNKAKRLKFAVRCVKILKRLISLFSQMRRKWKYNVTPRDSADKNIGYTPTQSSSSIWSSLVTMHTPPHSILIRSRLGMLLAMLRGITLRRDMGLGHFF